MKNIIIITPSYLCASAIKRYVEYNSNCFNIFIIEIPYLFKNENDIVLYNILDYFEIIVKRLEDFRFSELREAVVILDLGFWELELNPIRKDPFKSISVLASWLVLSFPDIDWIFLTMLGKDKENNIFKNHTIYWPFSLTKSQDVERFYNLLEIKDRTVPMFDALGLRKEIRKIARETNIVSKKTINYMIIRENNIAAAIDEEEEYAYLHGYIAYKLGYRCFVVTSMRLFKKLFSDKQDDQNRNWPLNIELTFEDMFLNFPDKDTDEPHLSYLRERDNNFKILKEVKNRILVTVGHKYIKWSEANKLYLKELKAKARAKGGIVRKIYKPSGGIYNTMEQAGLLKDYWKKRKDEWQKAKPGPNMEEAGGHSAPGRLLLIAEKLIERARKILDEANTVQDCIHGALLALEAQELLGYKTPTTCLEAIALKHQLEVKAECMFYGVGYNIDMKNRFKEIEGEVKAVSEWFHPSVRKKSYLNAQLGIITELVEILRDYGQFDEELQCLKKIRKLNRQFYFLNQPGLKFVQPLRAYIDTLVGSFPLFCGALFFWPVFYGLLGYLFNTRYEGYKDGILTFWEQVANSSYTFFGLQPSSQPIDTISHVLTIFTVLTGFLHLGIFISYLYNLIFRK
jgi:hypothetical protein